jgi:hypothetical protein
MGATQTPATTDIVESVAWLIGLELHPWQKAALRESQRRRRVVVVGGRESYVHESPPPDVRVGDDLSLGSTAPGGPNRVGRVTSLDLGGVVVVCVDLVPSPRISAFAAPAPA